MEQTMVSFESNRGLFHRFFLKVTLTPFFYPIY
jgi:hypothetical protein